MSSENNPTRARILDATLQLLEQDGAAAVRMADIAKRAKISRQALYLHFPNRAELLIAAVRHVDEIKKVDARLAASRQAASGAERLRLWVEAWGSYIPDIYGVAKALIAIQDRDAEAKAAWDDRMQAVRAGCAAVVDQLQKDGTLKPGLPEKEATDLLFALVSVSNWEGLRVVSGWPQERFISVMTEVSEQALLRN